MKWLSTAVAMAVGLIVLLDFFFIHPILNGVGAAFLGKGGGPFPGILNPHGHWAEGRCKAVRQGPVWIDPAAVERAYPGR